MRRPTAIAISAEDTMSAGSFHRSLVNFSVFLIDLMYGTKERTRITCFLCIGLIAAGMMISANEANALTVCPA